MNDLPAPLTAPDCDVSQHRDLPLDIARFRRSRLYLDRSDNAFAAGFLLMAASWHSEPAASLLDDDRFLAYVAGYGPAVRRWKRVRESALADWIKCSDGRLYHPEIARVANERWLADLLRRGNRALKLGQPVQAIGGAVRDTLMRMINADQFGRSIARRADAWLTKHAAEIEHEYVQRRVAAGRQALIALKGGKA